ncbi:CheY-like chemotaxis protein [Desulfosalsimonas propionicica]|uniref:histidine kinase n=2 Tax=Desulfosalsimonas propionicica TaxID=332175 RepID=A0A7W0HKQ0_9BACT|nr:CheY-like chemotaxis protein [Desulfosalsimonas propionicica]
MSADRRSTEITRQLLAFSRQQTIVPESLDVNETVESMLKMLRRLIGEDIDLSWQPRARKWKVYMDPSQIDQILVNLCVNARHAIADVGRIIIETETRTFDEDYCATNIGFTPGDFVMLSVNDNGCGMDKKTQNRIFEPFFTTKKTGEGTGLGLATVYGIVKQNEGFINVYSEPGNGTTFKIYLPKHETMPEETKSQAALEPEIKGTETVLLVEDEQQILHMTTMMLEKLGYTVLAAQTPAEAMDTVKAHTSKIDLLMTDAVMPEMNGRELSENIKSLHQGLKVMFMSGYTADLIAHRGVLDEGVNFIQKPFPRRDLALKLREILDEADQ